MKKEVSLYIVLLTTALAAGIFISFLAIRSIDKTAVRTVTLPGFTPDPNAAPRPTIKPTLPILSPTPSEQQNESRSQSDRGSSTEVGRSSISQPSPSGSGEIGTNRTPSTNQILFDVPFTPQAPFYEWDNPKLSNGCEEASALMAMSWVRGTTITPETARKEIITISDYELASHGVFLDTSAQDTVDWIFKEYYKYQNVELSYDVSVEDIKRELRNGNLVIVPVNGQELHNPYYTQPGPLRHKVIITGYDPDNREFITNDPGTIHGKSYRYPEEVLFGAIHDYLTGNDLPLPPKRTAMIVVKK